MAAHRRRTAISGRGVFCGVMGVAGVIALVCAASASGADGTATAPTPTAASESGSAAAKSAGTAAATTTTAPALTSSAVTSTTTATATATASAAATATSSGTREERRRAGIAKGVEFLLKSQAEDGSWTKANVGITALCADALLAAGKTMKDAPVRRAVEFLLKQQKADGGIHDDSGIDCYSTSIAVMVLVKADAKAYGPQIAKAIGFLTEQQWDGTESIDEKDARWGGVGYGKDKRPDLSNTHFFVEALRAADLPKDHPAWAKVVVFITHCQASSETNNLPLVHPDDGGFFYVPAAPEEMTKGKGAGNNLVDLPSGKRGLRTYGSMTYAGFKSFLYARLEPTDKRVEAAVKWVREHWTFEENPGVGQQGLFYYYQLAAKALTAYSTATKSDAFMDAKRRSHDWRAELAEAILAKQREDGSWYNETDRWFEGKEIAPVPTSYCITALTACEK
jgi:squalene-hopene/tetraprenyl-beta-curcumene cyclase